MYYTKSNRSVMLLIYKIIEEAFHISRMCTTPNGTISSAYNETREPMEGANPSECDTISACMCFCILFPLFICS
jgi:hypothetical protein